MPKLHEMSPDLQRKECCVWHPKSAWIDTVYAIYNVDKTQVFVTMTSKNAAGQEDRAIQVGWVDRQTFLNWTSAPSAGAFYNAYVKKAFSTFHPAVREEAIAKAELKS